MLTVKNQIFHILSDSTAETKIMVPRKQTLEEVLETDVFNQLDIYRFKGIQRTGNRSNFMCYVGDRDNAIAPTGRAVPGQGDMAPLL